MEITFSNPYFLLFLLSIPLLVISHFFTMVYLKRRAFKFANIEAIKRVTGGEKASFRNTIFLSRNLGVLILRVIILMLLIFSAAGTTLWLDRLTSDFDVVIAIDASSSMLADDFNPTRLEAAKKAAAEFVTKLTSKTSVGVISFSGTVFIEQSKTTSADDALEAIDGIQIKRIGGTDLGSAIIQGTNIFLGPGQPNKARILVLLTDGQGNIGPPIEEAIDYARTNQVKVYTLGVATAEGGQFLRTEGISTIDEPTLQKISTETGGYYSRVESSQKLTDTFNDILSSSRQKSPVNISHFMLLTALIMIFMEWGLISTKFRSIP
ncbi:MAG: vWA domain-containing protein [Nanoarchaeota archaeon]